MAEAAPLPVSLPKGAVPIRGPDGQILPYAEKDAAQAIDAGGEVVSAADYHAEARQQALEAKFGGVGGAAAAAGAGAVKGLTFGASHAIAPSVAEVFGGAEAGRATRETLAGLEEANPTASTVGELAGAAGPLLLSGGAAAAGEVGTAGRIARGLGAIPRGVSAAGRAVEGGVARALTREGAGLAERTAVRAVSGASSAALEGAAWGAGHEAADAGIQDHDLTAEKLLAGAGRGAFIGALAGGGIGAFGELATSGARGLVGAVAKREGGESIAELLDRKSGELAFRAAGGRKSLAEAADKFGGGYAEMGKVWREEAPALVGKRSFGELTREELREAASKGIAKEGERLGNILTRVDELAVKAEARAAAEESSILRPGRRRAANDNGAFEAAANDNATLPKPRGPGLPRAVDVVQDIEEAAQAARARAGSTPIANRLQSFADDVKRITGMVDAKGELVEDAADKTLSFTRLRDFRADADNIWAGSKVNPELFGYRAEFKALRDKLEQRLMDGAEAVAKEEGGAFAKEYQAAKSKYQAFKMLSKATQSGVGSQATNQSFGLTDKIAGGALAQTGATIGAAIGGAPGAAVGGALGGLAGGAVNRVVRERGDFVGAQVLSEMRRMAAMEHVAASVDQRIHDGVRAFLSGGRVELENAAAKPSREETIRVIQNVHAMRANPALIERHAERVTGNLGPTAPNVTRALAQSTARTLAFLGSVAPAMRTNGASLQPQLEKPRISESEVAKFQRYLSGIHADPAFIFSDMKKGLLPRERIAALQATSPKMFEQMRDAVLGELPSLKTKLDYNQKTQLSIAFGMAVDDTLTPDFIAAVQASKAPPAPENDSGPAPEQQLGSRRPYKLDTDLFESPSEAIASSG